MTEKNGTWRNFSILDILKGESLFANILLYFASLLVIFGSVTREN
jgi:hypothetical protein